MFSLVKRTQTNQNARELPVCKINLRLAVRENSAVLFLELVERNLIGSTWIKLFQFLFVCLFVWPVGAKSFRIGTHCERMNGNSLGQIQLIISKLDQTQAKVDIDLDE